MTLTDAHVAVLKIGLSFVPNQAFDIFEWVKDINLFARKLALKKEYKDKPRQQTDDMTAKDIEALGLFESLQRKSEGGSNDVSGSFSPFKPSSIYTPLFLQRSHIQLFVKLVERDLQPLWEKRGGRQKSFNLSFEEWKALQKLRNNKSLVIKPADKGGNIVLTE